MYFWAEQLEAEEKAASVRRSRSVNSSAYDATRSVSTRAREQIDGERGKPMFTGVFAAGHVLEPGVGVARRRAYQGGAYRVTSRQSRRDASHAPRAAQVQSIQMHELRVAPVGHDSWLEQSCRLGPSRAG